MKKLLTIFLVVGMIITLSACKNNDKEKITVVLDWTPNTNHTGLYVALDKGYFLDEGLDVEIVQPQAGSAEQLVAANKAQFGISYQEGVTYARAGETPIVSIAAIIQHNTSGFASLSDKGIESPTDFVGKTYGGWGTEVEKATIKALMEASDPTLFDGGKTVEDLVNFVEVSDYNFFAPGDLDFTWEYEAWTLTKADIDHVDYNYIPLIDIDPVFDYYTPVIITSEKMIEKNHDTVEKFMNAVQKGYKYAIDHPLDAAESLLKSAPELDRELVIASQNFLADKYQADASVWGIQKQQVWEDYTNWLISIGELDANSVDVTKAYSNEFIDE